jgi:hypothetical protein
MSATNMDMDDTREQYEYVSATNIRTNKYNTSMRVHTSRTIVRALASADDGHPITRNEVTSEQT